MSEWKPFRCSQEEKEEWIRTCEHSQVCLTLDVWHRCLLKVEIKTMFAHLNLTLLKSRRPRTLKRLLKRSSLGRSSGSLYKPWRLNTHLRRTSGIWKTIFRSVIIISSTYVVLSLYSTCACCCSPCHTSSSPCIWGSYHWGIQNCRVSSTNPTPPYRSSEFQEARPCTGAETKWAPLCMNSLTRSGRFYVKDSLTDIFSEKLP